MLGTLAQSALKFIHLTMNNLNEESALMNFIGGKLHNFSSLHEIKKLVSGEGDEHKEKKSRDASYKYKHAKNVFIFVVIVI
jgi:hypothetical protein